MIGTISNWPNDREFPENEEHVYPDGRLLKRNDYPELFALIKYAYGGSGEEFRLPNFMGKIKSSQPVAESPDDSSITPVVKTLMRIK